MNRGLMEGALRGTTAPAGEPSLAPQTGRPDAAGEGGGEQSPGADPGPGAGRKVGLAARLWGVASGEQVLALVDQAVVSGTSFLTTILVGRACGAGELGVYSLGFSLLVSAACVQESLIALPYTIYRHRPARGTAAECAGSVLVHHALLSVLALLALTATAAILSSCPVMPGLAAVTWALAAVTPFALLREFGRRFAFAHLRMAQALALDAAVAAVQIAGLLWLASVGALSAVHAYGVIGGSCALIGAVWLYLVRGYFVIRWGPVWQTMRQSWALGKWLFASQVTLTVQGYFIHWLLAAVLGTAATGVYAACMTVVLFSNPLTLGLCNVLAPRTAHAFSTGGDAALRRVVFHTTLLLGGAMVVFAVVVGCAGENIMGLLYHGSQYQGYGLAVAVLALAMLAAAVGMGASNGLAAIERPDLIFKAGLVAVLLSVVLIPILVARWGVTGAAFGFLAGNAVGSAGRWLAFAAVVRRGSVRRAGTTADGRAVDDGDAPHGQPSGRGAEAVEASVMGVLQQFTGRPESGEWVIERRSEGAQAGIFAVRRRDGQRLWQTHDEVVVKLYKPAAHQGMDVVRGQFESLSRFHAQLNAAAVHGWNIHAPLPLYQCDRPLALVMTVVSGEPLTACLETTGRMTAEALESIARAVAAAMERYWSVDSQIHGDLNLDNILCDPAAGSLSFVDPGVLEDAFLCDGVARRWFPASRDLAYLLYSTAVDAKRTIGNPGARRRQQRLVEGVLRAFLKDIGSPAEGRRLLDEIQACLRVHLDRLQVSWSMRGLWRVVLRRIASRRLDGVLNRLRAEVGGA